MGLGTLLLILLTLPLAAAPFGYWLGTIKEDYRNTLHIAVYVMGFILVSGLYVPASREAISLYIPQLMGTGLLLKLDLLRFFFLWLTTLIWPLAMLYSTKYLIRFENRNRYYLFFLLTYFSTMGVFLSENIINLFTFFELMSLASYFLVIQEEGDYAHRAGASYLTAAIAGGLFLLLGILVAYNYAETLVISEMNLLNAPRNSRIAIGLLILIGFGIKASLYPLHFWLPKTYTAAPMPATIVLSAVLAKTGIFGILMSLHYLLRGEEVLAKIIAVLGMATILWGGLQALFQRNMKRTLAYSSMSQMGYILLAVALIDLLGSHGQPAIFGALFHSINHGLIKTLLFIIVGLLFMAGGEYSINGIYGIGRRFGILKWFFLLGAVNLMGLPGSAGYASKTMIHEALLEAAKLLPGHLFNVLNICYYVGSALTVAYMIKLFVAIFLEKYNNFSDSDLDPKSGQAGWTVMLPVIVLSGILLVAGIWPQLLYGALGSAASIAGAGADFIPHLFTGEALLSSLKSILPGIFIYLFVGRFYLRRTIDGRVEYINPLARMIRLEEDLIVPFFSRLFRFALAVFTVLDQSITHLSTPLVIMTQKVTGILDPDPEQEENEAGKGEEQKVKEQEPANGALSVNGYEFRAKIADKIEEINTKKEESAGRLLYKVSNSPNSMSNAVFLFGSIFVLSLLFIFLRSTILHY